MSLLNFLRITDLKQQVSITTQRRLFIGLLIFVVTFFRFWYATQLELIGDEAYYWYCSRHLDWSFFDKGPGAALTIFFGTHLFGDTVFGVRFFAVLLSAGTGIALFYLAKMLYSEKVAFWTLIIVLFIPLYAVGSILMTIDPLSVFFWAIGAIAFWKSLHVNRYKKYELFFWILAGAFVGLGMLAKYTNLAELICFALFCGWSHKERYQLKRSPFYLMIGTALLFSLPMIIWNIEHHAIGIVHLLQRGDINKSWHIQPSELLVFLGAQAGVISPLIFLGVIVSVFWPNYFLEKKEETRFLISLFVPLFLFYSCLSLNKAAEPNWTALCYVSGVILLAGNWRALVQRLPWVRRLAIWAICIAAFETVLLHNTFWLHLPIPSAWENSGNELTQKIVHTYQEIGKVDPLDRAHGAASIAERAQKLAQEYGVDFFISDNYQTAGLLSFYLPGHPDTYEPRFAHVKDQFSLWPSYKDQFVPGAKALFVYAWKYPPLEIQYDFSKIKLVEESYSLHGKRPIKKQYYWLCEGLH